MTLGHTIEGRCTGSPVAFVLSIPRKHMLREVICDQWLKAMVTRTQPRSGNPCGWPIGIMSQERKARETQKLKTFPQSQVVCAELVLEARSCNPWTEHGFASFFPLRGNSITESGWMFPASMPSTGPALGHARSDKATSTNREALHR